MCTFDGCGRARYARGYCEAHYQQVRLGRPLTPVAAYRPRRRVGGTLAERLAAKSERQPDGCLLWTGSLKPNGYGKLVFEGRNLYTHRAAYEVAYGPIPPDLTVDHLCKVRHCMEPTHMELVTLAENVRRGSVKTHCKRGHSLDDPDNVTWAMGGAGGRYLLRTCKTCAAMRRRELYRLRRTRSSPAATSESADSSR